MSRRYLDTKKEGEETETLLEQFLTSVHGPLEKTGPTCPFDCKGTNCWVEIKGRSAKYVSDDEYAEAGWFIGNPKIVAAAAVSEPVFFYYYFNAEPGQVWRLQYTSELFDTFKPFKNRQGQLTFKVPKKHWARLQVPTA